MGCTRAHDAVSGLGELRLRGWRDVFEHGYCCVFSLFILSCYPFYLTVKVLSCIYNSYDSYLSYYELIMISDYEYNCIRNINVFVMARFIVSNGKKAI